MGLFNKFFRKHEKIVEPEQPKVEEPKPKKEKKLSPKEQRSEEHTSELQSH